MCVYAHVCVCARMCLCVCMCMYVCVRAIASTYRVGVERKIERGERERESFIRNNERGRFVGYPLNVFSYRMCSLIECVLL